MSKSAKPATKLTPIGKLWQKCNALDRQYDVLSKEAEKAKHQHALWLKIDRKASAITYRQNDVHDKIMSLPSVGAEDLKIKLNIRSRYVSEDAARCTRSMIRDMQRLMKCPPALAQIFAQV